jgi:hypothetical protein
MKLLIKTVLHVSVYLSTDVENSEKLAEIRGDNPMAGVDTKRSRP